MEVIMQVIGVEEFTAEAWSANHRTYCPGNRAPTMGIRKTRAVHHPTPARVLWFRTSMGTVVTETFALDQWKDGWRPTSCIFSRTEPSWESQERYSPEIRHNLCNCEICPSSPRIRVRTQAAIQVVDHVTTLDTPHFARITIIWKQDQLLCDRCS